MYVIHIFGCLNYFPSSETHIQLVQVDNVLLKLKEEIPKVFFFFGSKINFVFINFC